MLQAPCPWLISQSGLPVRSFCILLHPSLSGSPSSLPLRPWLSLLGDKGLCSPDPTADNARGAGLGAEHPRWGWGQNP